MIAMVDEERIDQARSELTGFEFDWLLRDEAGFLAVCETAGFGEVPDALLAHGAERLKEDEEAIGGILQADLTEAGCREQGSGVGDDHASLGYGRRGLYVFDWKHWAGPYRRIVVPERPQPASTFERLLGDALRRAPVVRVRFAHCRSFQLPDHLPCRRL